MLIWIINYGVLMNKTVLNVGGNSKAIPLPEHFAGWQHILLDIDASGNPDIVCDARQLSDLEQDQFDAIYCSHNLEHYHRHDVTKVLSGFLHVLKPLGFAHIRVPDIGALFNWVVSKNLDIDDVLYEAPGGPVHVYDVLYGWQQQIAKSGNDFFAHKNGFTEKSLVKILREHGFNQVYHGTGNLEVVAFAFINKPTDELAHSLNLPVAN